MKTIFTALLKTLIKTFDARNDEKVVSWHFGREHSQIIIIFYPGILFGIYLLINILKIIRAIQLNIFSYKTVTNDHKR